MVCFSTKAVHLEALSSLSANCLLAILSGFVARRGLGRVSIQIVGQASLQLANILQKFMSDTSNQNNILNDCAQRLINRKPLSAQHMGKLRLPSQVLLCAYGRRKGS